MLTLLWVVLVVGAFIACAFAGHWLFCRLTAKPCPSCGERWLTELVGEWDGEDWHCRRCGHYWTHREPVTKGGA